MTRTVGMRIRSLTRTSLVGAIGRSSSHAGMVIEGGIRPAGKEGGRTMRFPHRAPVGHALPPRSRWELSFQNPGSLRLGVRSRRLLLRDVRGVYFRARDSATTFSMNSSSFM